MHYFKRLKADSQFVSGFILGLNENKSRNINVMLYNGIKYNNDLEEAKSVRCFRLSDMMMEKNRWKKNG